MEIIASNGFLFLALACVFGLFMAWAFWEYRKTQKLVEQDRKKAEALKQKDAAS